MQKIRNAADEQAVKEQKVQANLKRTQLISDLNAVLSTPEGLRLMTEFLSWFNVFKPVGPVKDASLHGIHAIKDMGLQILDLCEEAKPESHVHMYRISRRQE